MESTENCSFQKKEERQKKEDLKYLDQVSFLLEIKNCIPTGKRRAILQMREACSEPSQISKMEPF